MFPFWEIAVAPVLEASGARRIVEIGALRGENTRQIINRLGPDTELHVIDPVPDFDPAVQEQEFAGQYVFHRDLSLNVLGHLPPMDAALIDGDHNWYTVYNELRLLREVARAADAPLPVLILHDVGWPYGRRDLYYDPDTIPAEFRRDWRRAGMEPGKVRLVPFGHGLNPTMANAKAEGGRRNGVMTAVEDFVAEHDRPLRVVVLPIYFGLAIVVEQARLDANAALADELDRLESPAGKDDLLELAESIRLDGLIFQHKIFFERERSVDRLARRYLGQLRENLAPEPADRVLLDNLQASLGDVVRDHALGDVVVCGAAPPAVSRWLAACLAAYEVPERQVWLIGEDGATVEALRADLDRLEIAQERVQVVAGAPDRAIDRAELPDHIALLYLGAHTADTSPGVADALAGRVSPGGVVLTDDATPAMER